MHIIKWNRWPGILWMLGFLFAASLRGQTTITDVIRLPTGGAFTGRIQITAPDMTWQDKTFVRATREYVVSGGVFSASLVPNDTATPAGTSYSVRFIPDSGAPWSQIWVVPTSAQALRINQIRVLVPPPIGVLIARAQISTAGANEGDCLKLISGTWQPAPCGAAPTPTGKTWAQLTTFTWSSLTTTTWSQLQ